MDKFINLLKQWFHHGLGTPIALIVMLSMMVLPLPPFILDFLFTFNISFGLIVILAAVYCYRPLDFAVFPTVILLTTLLRLALNIASTRVVLLHGHTGTAAAGQVIQSFGQVVIGGNYTVGLVIFAILVVINFVVVTKGAGRVSEVSARFTLDSLPGKQMAIDADLNAGIISQEEALKRREEVTQESDFYGAMDGASKFVRGDAIAGIVILFINIVGGIVIGMTQHNMSFSAAATNYVLLTIGDGLVAQIPSIILSTATAIIVTRVSRSHDMGAALLTQVFGDNRSLVISGAIICSLGLIPGMPHFSFIFVATLMFIGAYLQMIKQQRLLATSGSSSSTPTTGEEALNSQNTVSRESVSKELSWDDIQPLDIICLEIGYRLIPLVDTAQGGVLLSRIKGVRKKLSQDLGFLLPSVHIRDNLELTPPSYSISMGGVVMGEAEIEADKMLAINPGQVFGQLEGKKTTDPAFGLEAMWISEKDKEKAQSLGYTVVDPSTVIATHLSKILKSNASQLLGYEETQALLDKLSKSSPKLVKELVPDLLSLGTVNKVLQSLLSESIPISDIRLIVESLVHTAIKTKDLQELVGSVRVSLADYIVQQIVSTDQELPIITLQPELEKILIDSMSTNTSGGIEPSLADNLQQSIRNVFNEQQKSQKPVVIVVQPPIRSLLARFVRGVSLSINVLSYHEIPDSKQVRIVGTIG